MIFLTESYASANYLDRMIEQESIICAKQIAAAIDSRRQGFNSDLHGIVIELVCDVSGQLYFSTVLSMFWKAADTTKIQEKQNFYEKYGKSKFLRKIRKNRNFYSIIWKGGLGGRRVFPLKAGGGRPRRAEAGGGPKC